MSAKENEMSVREQLINALPETRELIFKAITDSDKGCSFSDIKAKLPFSENKLNYELRMLMLLGLVFKRMQSHPVVGWAYFVDKSPTSRRMVNGLERTLLVNKIRDYQQRVFELDFELEDTL